MSAKVDTICAIATPSGRGGVGIVRLSGPKSFEIAQTLYPPLPPPRQAALRSFKNTAGDIIDEGLVLTFQAPHSFTGEDVVEIQAHGSPVVLNLLVESLISQGARLAEPGEFSKRAYLNNRIDLVQAEAIADLIEATTEQAARAAQHSLQGVFSEKIHGLVNDLTELRVYVEASLDFPDEDVDFLADGQVAQRAQHLLDRLVSLITQAKQGQRFREGARLCLVGHPNAGKSSLLNVMSQKDSAIVTDIPGTTRDVVTEEMSLAGIPISLSDTAGLRETDDPVEAMGVARAKQTMDNADLILWVIDGEALPTTTLKDHQVLKPAAIAQLQADYPALGNLERVIPVVNKIDQINHPPGSHGDAVWVSAKTEEGIDTLASVIQSKLGLAEFQESAFSARSRHLDALDRAHQALVEGVNEINQTGSGELLAESLKSSAHALGEITGQMSPDELLGQIFSSFCIGK